jgi:hypothetical protein
VNPFVPAWLDDLSLNARQMRVLIHLWRRGQTYSNASTIAAVCHLNRDTVFSILADLEAAGLIRRTPRPGRTTLIEPVPQNQTGRDANPSPKTGQGVSPKTRRHPSPKTSHEGIPSKGNPQKVHTHKFRKL